MKRSIISMAVVMVMMCTVVVAQGASLATDTGFYAGMKHQNENYMPTEPDAQPMHIKNTGPVVGFSYDPTVTKLELQAFYTQLEIPNALMPGIGLRDEKFSGLGVEFSQGLKLLKTGDVRMGGFVNYVYHHGLFGQNYVIPTKAGPYPVRVDIPRFHQLRTGGILQGKPADCLTVYANGGYQLQGGFAGGGAAVRVGSVEIVGEYFRGIDDNRDSYTVSTTFHF